MTRLEDASDLCKETEPNPDLPHDTDFPYVIRIIDDLRVIRPYHILIRNCFKYTENTYTTYINDNRRFKIH